jgi:hypothetical protein
MEEAAMRNDSPGEDPRTIWQNQPTEPSAMTLLLIRKKTRELHAKTRWELLKSIAGPVIVLALGGFFLRFLDWPLRVVFAFATVWSIAGQYYLNRGMWSAAMPADTALNTSFASYRREVERRRFLFSRVLQWNLGPVLVAIGTCILAGVRMGILNRTTLPKAAPFLTLMTIWLAAVVVIRIRQQRDLQREIDDLNEIERADR